MRMEKADELLARMGLDMDGDAMRDLLRRFLDDMHEGLAGHPASLMMLPSYCRPAAPVPDHPVIIIDAGGTNFRTALVTFDRDGKARFERVVKSRMPGLDREVSKAEFFGMMADQVEPLFDASDRIGFCFSYAMDATDDHDGVVLVLGKEIKAPEVIGCKVGSCLLEELARRGHEAAGRHIVVLNDTVATLLAASAAESGRSFDGQIGFILGTGTNIAYVERNRRIGKIKEEEGSQIVNMESGCFDYPAGPFAREVWQATEEPAVHHFEKLISGAYLGLQCRLLLGHAVRDGLFSPAFATRFAGVSSLSTIQVNAFLQGTADAENPLVMCSADNQSDKGMVEYLCRAVIAHAAKLTAVNLASAIIQTDAGKDPNRPVCINADGTTFWKTDRLRALSLGYLRDLVPDHAFQVVHIEDSPGIGAAVAALS